MFKDIKQYVSPTKLRVLEHPGYSSIMPTEQNIKLEKHKLQNLRMPQCCYFAA
jgi:hypothetical protein